MYFMKMNNFRTILQKSANYAARLLLSFSRRLQSKSGITLSGTREIEWTWIMAALPFSLDAKDVLDFGPGPFPLITITAARKGANVICFDVRSYFLPGIFDNISWITGDILAYDFGDKQFDYIFNCSTVEHVGLARYGDQKDENGDLKAMAKLRQLLKPHGKMILTLPVGQDNIHGQYHRVYGNKRLPQLLAGFRKLQSEYWIKEQQQTGWQKVSQQRALTEKSSPYYYGLGLFVLEIE